MKKDELIKTASNIISNHFRRDTRKWYIDSNTREIEATEEQTKEFQAKIRNINFSIQIIEEEKIVTDFFDNNIGSEDKAKKYMPLVSRRRHPELWFNIRKGLPDGSLFTFEPEPIPLGVFCNCTDDDIIKDNELNNPDNRTDGLTDAIIRIRQLHNNGLEEKDHWTKPYEICHNPLERYAHQNKHSIGNWNCKACLNVGTEIASEESATAAMTSGKALEWCPKFFPVLRHLPIIDYLQTTKGQNVCYAGLVHTEMSFLNEDTELTDEDKKLIINPPSNLEEKRYFLKKTYVLIKKKCDNCEYYSEEKKEYIVPEQIHNEEVLQVIP
jgi:hypothetical protein